MSVPTGVARSSRRAVGALVAVLVALACTVLWLMALAAPSATMPDMTGMAGTSVEAGVSMMAGMRSTTAVAATDAVADLAAGAGPAMASMCDTACVGGVVDVCTLAAGLAVTTVLALLLSSRRNTFLRLLARPGAATLVHRRPRWLHSPWTVLSLFSLGVLRV